MSTKGMAYSIIDSMSEQEIQAFVYRSLSPAQMKNIHKVSSFSNLKKGWNGYDAEPIDTSLIERVKEILVSLSTYQPEVFPTGRNSIQLEYEKENGDYLEFEIFEDGKISMYLSKGNEEVEELITVENIRRKVENFYG